jgi:hypothetical protein
VNKTLRVIQFIQATVAVEHEFKLDYFNKAYNSLSLENKNEYEIKIFFLTNNLIFRIGNVHGSFPDFAPNHRTAQAKAKVIFVDFNFN